MSEPNASVPNLTLQDQLFLLCVRPREGDVTQPRFRYLLAGAALAILLEKKRIGLKMGRVQVRETAPIGDEAIDAMFARFGTTTRPRPPAWWVRHFYPLDAIPTFVLGERLSERGILTTVKHRALWIINWRTYPVLEPAYGLKLQRQVRAAVMEDGPVADWLAILIAILHNGRALDKVLSASERTEREHRIATIAAQNPVGYAVGKALADTLSEEEIERERARRHGSPPIVVVRPPRHRHPSRRPRKWKNTFPGDRPDENGVWSVEEEADDTAPV